MLAAFPVTCFSKMGRIFHRADGEHVKIRRQDSNRINFVFRLNLCHADFLAGLSMEHIFLSHPISWDFHQNTIQ